MTRKLPSALTILALAGGAAFAGCGGDDSSSSSTGTSTTETTTTTAPSASSGDTVAVSMKDVTFKPESVTVKVGQTIKWTNDDPIDHTVTAKDGADFDSGNVKSGGTFEFKATKAGTINYVCTIHPSQTGSITVQ